MTPTLTIAAVVVGLLLGLGGPAAPALTPAAAAPPSWQPAPEPDPGDGATLELVLGEYAFTPAAPSTPVGPVRLRLHNAGLRRHNLVIFADGVEHGPRIVLPGETILWDAPVSQPGHYEFWCSEYRHLEKGMGGVLTLTEEPQG